MHGEATQAALYSRFVVDGVAVEAVAQDASSSRDGPRVEPAAGGELALHNDGLQRRGNDVSHA